MTILADSITIFIFPALWNKSNSEIEKLSNVFEVKVILMTNIKHNVHVCSKISVRSIPKFLIITCNEKIPNLPKNKWVNKSFPDLERTITIISSSDHIIVVTVWGHSKKSSVFFAPYNNQKVAYEDYFESTKY